MQYRKEDFNNNSELVPKFLLGFQTVSNYVQNEDKKSFDRVKLANLIPTINGIKITELIILK
tara:strand:- start:1173 stop:1358 length:186 start_codon:yes stop_codon:yes gene_type:complete